MKKLLSLCLALLLVLICIPMHAYASEIASGTCGENLTWVLDKSGTLTISGIGSMYDYESFDHPWYSHSDSITNVIICDGVSTISDNAFSVCNSLTSVTIPDSVTTIGYGVFYSCVSLISVTIPDSVTTIGESAFMRCHGLTSVTIPKSVTTIGDAAFAYCGSLTDVTIPDSVTTIGDNAFSECNNLTSVTIPKSVTTIGEAVFCNCTSLTDVYYTGEEEQWNQISIASYNEALTSAVIHFNTNDFSAPIESSSAVANTDAINAYRDVLTMYYTSISCNWSNCDGEGLENVGDPDNASYIISKYEAQRSLEEVGYCLLDTNADGHSELIVSMLDLPRTYTGAVYDLYTIVGGNIIHVVTAGEHAMYNLGEDYSINYRGSNGAAYSIDANYRLDGADGRLKINQAVIFDGRKDSKNPYFYTTTDYDMLTPISNAEASVLLDSFPENVPLSLTSFAEYDPSAHEESDYEDYARTEWIEQHMEYAASDEYQNEIIGGYSHWMMEVFRDACKDSAVNSYKARKTASKLLGLDFDFSESDMYELILAQILFGKTSRDITEESFMQNLCSGTADTAKALADLAKNADGLPEDVQQSIQELYDLLQTLEFSSIEYWDTYLEIIRQFEKNVSNVKSKFMDDAYFATLGISFDWLFQQYASLADIIVYINNYTAYRSVSQQTRVVLQHLSAKTFVEYDSWSGVHILRDELGLVDSIINWASFQEALESVLVEIELSSQEAAEAAGMYAVEQFKLADRKLTMETNKTVSVFALEKALSCIPVMKIILTAKNAVDFGLNVSIYLDSLFTDIVDREYAVDMLVKTYCISLMLDETVESCAENMSYDDFHSTTVFDEAVSIYCKNQLLASSYIQKYADLVVADALAEVDKLAFEKAQTSFEKEQIQSKIWELNEILAWYSRHMKDIEAEKKAIQLIACHNSTLSYDSATDNVIDWSNDARIYIVACPVDVIVNDATGKQIAYLSGVNDQVIEGYEFYFHTIKTTDDSGQYIKVAIVPDGYHIELAGTDDGTMNAFVTDFTTGDIGEVETYFNIPIEKNSAGYFEVSSENSLVMDEATYFDMESVEDIPTNSESNVVWFWIVGSSAIFVFIFILIFKKSSRK